MTRKFSRRSAVAVAALAGTVALAPAVAGSASAGSTTVAGIVASSTAKVGTVSRWSGVDRYDASANISKASYDPGVATAYIASGQVFSDALSGAPVAGRDGGPVLLVPSDTLPASTTAELTRLAPKNIVVFGGKGSVSGRVITQLRKLTTGEVTRIAGPSRYSASAKISALNFAPGPAVAYVASGEVFPDALSGAPVAGATPGPLLLVEHDNVPGVVKKEFDRLKPQRIVVLGGAATIDEDTYAFLTRYTSGGITRWSGKDRFDASAMISQESFDPGVGTAFVASGLVYADALSAAPVAARGKDPILLVDTDSIPASIDAELKRLKPKNIVVVGGTASVSAGVEAKLASYLAP